MDIGSLYIIATPIGNLSDITFRAVEALKNVDLIAAEDTRHSKGLLQHYGVATKMIALHEHNEENESNKLVEQLLNGKDIALISDAGTPLISDPGYRLVLAAREKRIQVVPIPGACAAIAALSAAGMPSDRFLFAGFLPAKQGARTKKLMELQHEIATLIFYESPHRVLDSLKDMQAVFGEERKVVLARELTKQFETIQSDILKNLIAFVEQDSNQQRGEIVLLVHGAEKNDSELSAKDLETLQLLAKELPTKKAAEIAAKITGHKKNTLYNFLVK